MSVVSNDVSERRKRRKRKLGVSVKQQFSRERNRDGEIYVKPDIQGEEVQIESEFSKKRKHDGEIKIKPEIFEEQVQVTKKRKLFGEEKTEPYILGEAVQIKKKFSKDVKLKPDVREENVELEFSMNRERDEKVDFEPDILEYFKNVVELNLGDVIDSEERDCIAANVFEETIGKELYFSCNQDISRAIVKFLPFASVEVLLRFTRALSFDLHELLCKSPGAYVLEHLIRAVTKQIQKNGDEKLGKRDEKSLYSDPKIIRLQNWLREVYRFFFNDLEEFLWIKHCNYIIRTILQCLGGIEVKSDPNSQKKCRPMYVAQVSTSPIEEGHDLVEEFTNNLMQMHQFEDFPSIDTTSGLLQILLLVVHKVDAKLLSKLIKHLLDTCYDTEWNKEKYSSNNQFPKIFRSNAATCLMDTMIIVSTGKLFTQIYARCFIKRLEMLSCSPYANFCVQNLIKQCTEKVVFEAMFVKLVSKSHLQRLIIKNKHGILLALVQTCHRLSSKQGELIKKLQETFCCTDPEHQKYFALLIAYMVSFQNWSEKVSQGEDLSVSLNGSLIIQALLNFPETIQIVNSLLAIENEYLKGMLCDIRGSYIADAFFASKSVREKSRQKMCLKLQGSYVALATSLYGSRALDVVWAWASIKYKKIILEDLVSSESLINSVHCGNIFSEKSLLSLFKRHPEDWEEAYLRGRRREKLISDIIGCRE